LQVGEIKSVTHLVFAAFVRVSLEVQVDPGIILN
jgi:hypothetical protein